MPEAPDLNLEPRDLLDDFLDVVQRYESEDPLEKLFWDVRDASGNFLGRPLQATDEGRLNHFFGRWRSRRRPIGWDVLREIWNPSLQELTRRLEAVSIVDADPEGRVEWGPQTIRVGTAIRLLYGTLRLVPGVGATNASKLLSLTMTDLFVMWDALNMRSLQRYREGPNDFLRFWNDQRSLAKRLVEAVSTRTDRDPVDWLETLPLRDDWHASAPRRKPLAKLIEEYHYRKGQEAIRRSRRTP